MSQSVTTIITILRDQASAFEAICAKAGEPFAEKQELTAPSTNIAAVQYTFYETSHGELGFEDELIVRKIPYDKGWGDTVQYHRVDGGYVSIIKTWEEGQRGQVNINEVARAVKENRLERFIEYHQHAASVIPWNEQVEILADWEAFNARFAAG